MSDVETLPKLTQPVSCSPCPSLQVIALMLVINKNVLELAIVPWAGGCITGVVAKMQLECLGTNHSGEIDE